MGFPSKESGAGGSGALSATNWTQAAVAAQTMNLDGIGNIKASAINASTDCMAYRKENTFNPDQYAAVTIRGGLASGTNYAEVLVRCSGSGGSFAGYNFNTDGVTGATHTVLQKWSAGASSTLTNFATTFATGDTMKIAIVGSVISCYKNGALLGTFTDASLTTGAPGCGVFNSAANNVLLQNFEGGNVAEAYAVGTRRIGAQAGPYDQLGFLKRFPVASAVISASSPITITPDFGALQLDGFAPSISLPITILPGLGALTLTGFAPAVGLPVTINPATGALTLTGFAPAIGLPLTVAPGLGQLVLTGFAPSIGLPVTIRPDVGSLVLTGLAPSIGLPVTVKPDVGALTLTGFAPTVTVTGAVMPGVGDLQLTGFAPIVGLPVTITTQVGDLALTGFAPTIDTGVPPVVVTQEPAHGGRRITQYEEINPRRARAQAAKRRLDEERKRLARLKKQEAKLVAEYKAIALTEDPPLLSPKVAPSDRVQVLKLELTDLAERVSLQNAKVRSLRKEADQAKREAEDRTATEMAMQAHRELLAQSEWEVSENARLIQEQEDEEMQAVLLLIHEEDF